jgi:hypothetical protein
MQNLFDHIFRYPPQPSTLVGLAVLAASIMSGGAALPVVGEFGPAVAAFLIALDDKTGQPKTKKE